MTSSFVIEPRGAYRLAQSRDFVCGFTPAAGSAVATEEGLSLAFRLDRTFGACGVALVEEVGGVVHGDVVGTTQVDAAREQVARMLGLDRDARAWDAIGEKEPPIGALQRQFPGFRPVSFASPYEAGVWAVLAQRVPMIMAARIKKAVAEAHGDAIRVTGETLHAFPSPVQVLGIEHAPKSVPEEKWQRIRGLAEAAHAGWLDSETLAAMPYEAAIEKLSSLRGVGPWSAAHILVRGTGAVDHVAVEEPRVMRAVMRAYGLERDPSAAEVAVLAEKWKPFRTWAMVLMVLAMSRAGEWNVGAARGGRSAGGTTGGGAKRAPKKAAAAKKAKR